MESKSKLDLMGPNEFSMTGFDIPAIEEVPETFRDLMGLGAESWVVEIFNFKWEMATLQEYEARIIYKKLANIIDSNTKLRLMWVEVLTRCIMSTTRMKDNKIVRFPNEEEKAILRHILLCMDTKVIEALYKAYKAGEKQATDKFKRKFPDLQEKLHKDFFAIAGSSSEA